MEMVSMRWSLTLSTHNVMNIDAIKYRERQAILILLFGFGSLFDSKMKETKTLSSVMNENFSLQSFIPPVGRRSIGSDWNDKKKRDFPN